MSTTWSLVKNDLCNFLKHLSFEKKSLSFCPLSFPKMYLKRACTTECIATYEWKRVSERGCKPEKRLPW